MGLFEYIRWCINVKPSIGILPDANTVNFISKTGIFRFNIFAIASNSVCQAEDE